MPDRHSASADRHSDVVRPIASLSSLRRHRANVAGFVVSAALALGPLAAIAQGGGTAAAPAGSSPAPAPAPASTSPAAPSSAPASTTTPAPAANPAASGLVVRDVVVGTGKEAVEGDVLLVHYTGWLFDPAAPDQRGKQFDSSLSRPTPLGFFLGKGKVIKGWDQGLQGMRVGGKRTLIVPPELAYGEAGAGNGLIPPNSTLVFDVELVDAKRYERRN